MDSGGGVTEGYTLSYTSTAVESAPVSIKINGGDWESTSESGTISNVKTVQFLCHADGSTYGSAVNSKSQGWSVHNYTSGTVESDVYTLTSDVTDVKITPTPFRPEF